MKMHYVWKGVVVAILWWICNVKIAANLHYVCQDSYLAGYIKVTIWWTDQIWQSYRGIHDRQSTHTYSKDDDVLEISLFGRDLQEAWIDLYIYY